MLTQEKTANNCINLTILYAVSLCYTAYKMAGYAERYIVKSFMNVGISLQLI
jgi:hypothetical protein